MLRVTRAPKNNSRRILNLIAALVFTIALAGVGLGMSAPASAATPVFGYDTPGVGGGFLGAVRGPDGRLAYCIDPVGVFPSGATDSGTDVSSISARTAANSGGHGGTAAVSGVGIQKLNYSLAKFGESADSDNAAAAEAAYVYSITADYPYPTTNPQANVTYYIHARVPAADRAAVQAGYAAIAAEVDAHYATATPAGSTTTILMSPHPSLAGTVTVTVSPSASTGTLVLTGAVVAGTTDATVPVQNGQVVDITATALTGPHLYDITATSTFTVPTVPLPVVHLYTTGSPAYAQRDISVGGYVTGTVVSSAVDVDPLSGEFEPIVVTRVGSEFVSRGQPVSDDVTAELSGSGQAWGVDSNGTPNAVVARGNLYCSLESVPLVGQTPPADALVEGPVFLTFNGVGDEALATSLSCPTSGYATWVWTVDVADQAKTTAQNLPPDYHWSDDYGRASETTFVKASLLATTQVDGQVTGLFRATADSIHIALAPGTENWPTDASGTALRITITGTSYWVAGETTPAETALGTASGIAIKTVSLEVSAPGDYPSPQQVVAPGDSDGYVIWQWSMPATDYTDPWDEDFADPSQIVTVRRPQMTSIADSTTIVGGASSDTVSVTGPAMGESASLSWSVYRKLANSAPICDSSTLIFDSSSEPVQVRGPGKYALSIPPVFKAVGTYIWVATLTTSDGTVIDQGRCGDPTEITTVVPPLALTGDETASSELAIATVLFASGSLFMGIAVSRRRRRI